MKRAFISHISEEAIAANALKAEIVKDFLGFLEVFVSSDAESIAAGEEWLESIENALRDCAIFIVLCSPESIHRPWINFEAGAAWMRNIPLIPICHGGLLPSELPMPLSLRHGVALTDAGGLSRLYRRIAELLQCNVPDRDFQVLSAQLTRLPSSGPSKRAKFILDDERAIRSRLEEALNHPKYKWRTLAKLAATAGISVEEAANLLRSDPLVRFSRNPKKDTIVGLRSRVDGQKSAPSATKAWTHLRGEIKSDARSAAAWITLHSRRNFKEGQRIRFILGGPLNRREKIAEKVVVQLLRDDDDENQPVGMITQNAVLVPASRIVEITVPSDFDKVRVLSIHGGPNPFKKFPLGNDNGDVDLVRAEVLE